MHKETAAGIVPRGMTWGSSESFLKRRIEPPGLQDKWSHEAASNKLRPFSGSGAKFLLIFDE
jgi:hypothetical protein